MPQLIYKRHKMKNQFVQATVSSILPQTTAVSQCERNHMHSELEFDDESRAEYYLTLNKIR